MVLIVEVFMVELIVMLLLFIPLLAMVLTAIFPLLIPFVAILLVTRDEPVSVE